MKNFLFYHKFSSQIGNLFACSSNDNLLMLEFDDNPKLQFKIDYIAKLYKAEIVSNYNNLLHDVENQINQFFERKRTGFDLNFTFSGTDFQNKVWNSLLNIPFATTTTYKNIALEVADLTYVRAVANAIGQNFLNLIIPCHRVIGTNGKLTGYSGGLEKKKFLLEFEKNNIFNQ